MTQDIAGRRELTGPDVILLHRLLKNQVPEQTGIASYALFTSAAVEALDLAELKQDTKPYTADVDEFGRIEGVVVDFGARWNEHYMATKIVVGDDELWFEPVSRVVPHKVEAVWEAFSDPQKQSVWNTLVQGRTRTEGDPKRLRVGAVDHCAHGKETMVLRYVDVRPLEHLTIDTALPMDGRLRRTLLFSTDGDGTRLMTKCARPEGPNFLATFMLGVIGGLFHKKKVRADFRTELELLEGFLAENDAPAGTIEDAAMSLSEREIKETARGLAGGESQDL
jgi:uncharacterized protein YndB with AHSA1/START domain